MKRLALPADAPAGPTKPPVRSVLLDTLGIGPDDHVIEVGTCTGALTVELACRAGTVTTIERDPDRAAAARDNLAANGLPITDAPDDSIRLRVTEAPAGLPDSGDVLVLGGSRNYVAILDWALRADVDRIGMLVARIETAGNAITAFRDRDLLAAVYQLQVARGDMLAGATGLDPDRPVYLIVGQTQGSAPSRLPPPMHPDSAAAAITTQQAEDQQ